MQHRDPPSIGYIYAFSIFVGVPISHQQIMAQKHVELTTKNEEKEEEIIWKEMQFYMESKEFKEDDKAKDADAAAAADVDDTNDANEAAHGSNVEVQNSTERGKQSCQHELKQNEEIEILCRLCGVVFTEIRDVLPTFASSSCKGKQLKKRKLYR